jgi:glycosyltransferase involved in cell wall biosynthesis
MPDAGAMNRSTSGLSPVLFVIHQLGSQSDGGIQSITELLVHSSALCRQIIVTNIDSTATRRWRSFAEVRIWPMREFDLTRGALRTRSRSRQLAYRLRNNLRARSLVRRHGVRVVHCNDHIAFGNAGFGAKLAGARIVFNVRDTLRAGSRKRRMWLLFLRVCDRFLVLSREMVDAWRVDLEPLSGQPIQAAKFCFVYSIVDRQRYCPVDQVTRSRIRHRLGLVPGRPAVLSVGRIEDKKGQLHFLQHGLPLLVKRRPDVLVYFVGDYDPEHDRYAARCQAEVAAGGLDGHVRFVGYSAEIADWYRAADVVILTSKREGLPRCVIEGIASGASIVAFDVCSVREILEEHGCGVAVDRDDHGAMAAAIADLLADPQRAGMYRQRGPAVAAALFDARTNGAAFAGLLAATANG